MHIVMACSCFLLLPLSVCALASPSVLVAGFQFPTTASTTTSSIGRRAATSSSSRNWKTTQLAASGDGSGGMDAYEAQMAAMHKKNNQPLTTTSTNQNGMPLDGQSQATKELVTTGVAVEKEQSPPQSAVSGMDAFSVQLAAMNNDNQPTTKASAVSDVMDPTGFDHDRDNPSTATTTTPTTTTTGSHHGIGGLLLQRAIQTQLYYLADLRDEPTYVWLRGFLGHDHLDDRGAFNELDGLRCGGSQKKSWRKYLDQLEKAPPFTILVQLAPPRLSAQQKRNPFLAKEAGVGKSYEETIQPSRLSLRLRTVARSLEQEWVPVLTELGAADRARVHLYLESFVPQLQTAEAKAQAHWATQQVVAGGEGDDQETPLHALNCRLVERFCTRVALHRILEEMEGLSLPVDIALADGITTSHAEADAAAGQWLLRFTSEWAPKLTRGADDDERQRLGVAPPGQWKRLCKEGADADDVTEALWQELPQPFAQVSSSDDDALTSMRLYSPEALAARLRRARADICDELVQELRATVANEFSY